MSTIRLVRPDDAEALLKIYAPYVSDTAVSFEYSVPTLEAFQARIQEITAFFPYLVYEQGGQLCGYAYAHKHMSRAAYQWNAELSIYLRQDRIGHGIGTRLYRALLELLRLQGIRTAYGCVTIPNPASEALHRSLGFRQAGIWHNSGYKLGQWRDIAWFEKQLAPYDGNPTPPISVSELPDASVAAILNA